jgi:RNA 3'-terminal phosphate cyclase
LQNRSVTRWASSFTTRILTEHARTVMWLIEQFMPVRFTVESAVDHVQILKSLEGTIDRP